MREKQQEIESLRKERDLERERVTKAANQADQAEQSALSIKQEYDKVGIYRKKNIAVTGGLSNRDRSEISRFIFHAFISLAGITQHIVNETSYSLLG